MVIVAEKECRPKLKKNQVSALTLARKCRRPERWGHMVGKKGSQTVGGMDVESEPYVDAKAEAGQIVGRMNGEREQYVDAKVATERMVAKKSAEMTRAEEAEAGLGRVAAVRTENIQRVAVEAEPNKQRRRQNP